MRAPHAPPHFPCTIYLIYCTVLYKHTLPLYCTVYLHFWLQLQLQFHASGCTLRRAPMRMRRVHFKAAHLGRERVRVRVYSVYAYCKFQSPRSHSAACHKICHEQAILCAQENECAAQIRNSEFSNLQLPYSSHTLSRSLQAILYCSLFYCFLFISNLTVFFSYSYLEFRLSERNSERNLLYARLIHEFGCLSIPSASN